MPPLEINQPEKGQFSDACSAEVESLSVPLRHEHYMQMTPALDAAGSGAGKHAFGYLLKQWLRQSYDELGPIVLCGLFLIVMLFGAFAPLALIGSNPATLVGASTPPALLQLVFALFGLAGCALAWFAVIGYMDKILSFQYPTWSTLPGGLIRHLSPALATLLFLGLGASVLAFNLIMYPRMFPERPFLRLFGMAVTLWMGLFLGMVQVHLAPFLTHQGNPFRVALKRSAMVALWKPFRTAFILGVQTLFAMLCIQAPPLVLVLPGVFAALSVLSLLILLDEWRDPYEQTPESIRAGA